MRIFRTAAIAGIIALTAVSCGRNYARIEGTLSGAAEKNIVVNLLNVNTNVPIDTIKTDASGNFKCKVEIEKGKPEFLYLYYSDKKVASLLLEQGDVVKISADTLGNCSVEGSPESAKLIGIEDDFREFTKKMSASTDSEELSKLYIDYYRKCVKYIIENPTSLTCIPVLYQNLNSTLPIFSQATDALHFRNVSNSLSATYPESKYVKALKKETEKREQYLSLNTRLNDAAEVNYPDFTLPDINGKNVSLSSVDAKVIILYFWTSTDASQKLFNTDILKPLYNDFHKKGLEIVAVAADADKALWASVVKNQGLEWINLCDITGNSTMLYNASELPSLYMIENGQILDRRINGENALRKELNKILK